MPNKPRPKIRYKPIRKPPPSREEREGHNVARLEKRYDLTPAKVTKLILVERGLLINVCRSLKVPRAALNRYIKQHAECAEAMIQAKEAQGDKAEKKLFELIDAGDVRCILYYLSTVHRNRGYGMNGRPGPIDSGGDHQVFIETVNVVGVPSGTFLPKEKIVDHEVSPA